MHLLHAKARDRPNDSALFLFLNLFKCTFVQPQYLLA